MKKFSTDRDKLEQISNFFRLSAVDFAAKIDVSKDKIYNIRRGVVVNFPPDVLRNIAKCCPEIYPYWLITGEGPCSPAPSSTTTPSPTTTARPS